MTETKCDPVVGGIYEYCRTSKHRSVWNNKDDKTTDLKMYEFEFHKKRSFLSEVLQTTDMTLTNVEKYGKEYENPGQWFTPKYSVKSWSDWIIDLPNVSQTHQRHNHSHYDETESFGFHRNEWNNDKYQGGTTTNRFYGNQNQGSNRWELMDAVHFFTQKLFHQWKWNVRCAAFRAEREVMLGVIPLYHDDLIPFLFGCSLADGSPVLHRFGLESVFHRVIRSLRREQFGLILRAGAHEMVIRYSDIRVREERGSTWDNLIQEFLGLLRDQLQNRRLDDQRSLWENTAPGRIPGIILEWWVSWGEFWGTSAQTPVPWVKQGNHVSSYENHSPKVPEQETSDNDNEWEDEIMEEEDMEESAD